MEPHLTIHLIPPLKNVDIFGHKCAFIKFGSKNYYTKHDKWLCSDLERPLWWLNHPLIRDSSVHKMWCKILLSGAQISQATKLPLPLLCSLEEIMHDVNNFFWCSLLSFKPCWNDKKIHIWFVTFFYKNKKSYKGTNIKMKHLLKL